MKHSARSLIALGLVQGYLKPRLALDGQLPSLDAVTAILARRGFDKAQAVTAIRRAGAGLLASDADLSDAGEFVNQISPMLDQEEGTNMDPKEIVDAIKELFMRLQDDDKADLLDELGGMETDRVEPAEYGGVDPTPGEDRYRRRLGRDEPEPFPGRPRPGGTMDPIYVNRSKPTGEDARRRLAADRMALDAARRYDRNHPAPDGRGFAARYPDAARIRVS